jgi:putative ABC transport system ATP-binding protein
VAKRPAVLLCDEPTGALDIKTGRMVLTALQNIHKTLGTTTAIITHNAAIGRMADRIVHIAGGRIAQVDVNPHPVTPDQVDW